MESQENSIPSCKWMSFHGIFYIFKIIGKQMQCFTRNLYFQAFFMSVKKTNQKVKAVGGSGYVKSQQVVQYRCSFAIQQ